MTIALLGSAARTSSNFALPAIPNLRTVRAGVFLLNVTSAASAESDTLDVYIQSSCDGTNFNDFIHFPRIYGNGGAKVYEARWVRDVVPSSETGDAAPAAMRAPKDKTMSVGVLQGLQGITAWRIAWAISGGSSKSFTFSVLADLIR